MPCAVDEHECDHGGSVKPYLSTVDGSHEQITIADRAGGALLGTFVGDALGMPFEGLPPASIPRHVEMTEARLGRGTYTDDTQMMIALAESLIARGRVDGE